MCVVCRLFVIVECLDKTRVRRFSVEPYFFYDQLLLQLMTKNKDKVLFIQDWLG